MKILVRCLKNSCVVPTHSPHPLFLPILFSYPPHGRSDCRSAGRSGRSVVCGIGGLWGPCTEGIPETAEYARHLGNRSALPHGPFAGTARCVCVCACSCMCLCVRECVRVYACVHAHVNVGWGNVGSLLAVEAARRAHHWCFPTMHGWQADVPRRWGGGAVRTDWPDNPPPLPPLRSGVHAAADEPRAAGSGLGDETVGRRHLPVFRCPPTSMDCCLIPLPLPPRGGVTGQGRGDEPHFASFFLEVIHTFFSFFPWTFFSFFEFLKILKHSWIYCVLFQIFFCFF